MTKFLNKLSEFFQDNTGSLSAMRLLLLTWGVGVFVLWVILCIHTWTLVPLDIKLVGFIITLVGGKMVQNNQENTLDKNNLPLISPSTGSYK